MKRHQVQTKEQWTVLKVEANTKAGLITETLLAFVEASGIDLSKDNEPKHEITEERDFVALGNDASSTLAEFCRKVIELGAAHKEIYLEAKLTLVTDKKVQGYLHAIKTGLVHIPWEVVSSVKGPGKTDDGAWQAEIVLQ
jgi:hypothetical protein